MNQLPEHDPRPDLWARIEADLNYEDRLEQALRTLSDHDPGDVWAALEARLEQTGSQPVKRLIRWPNAGGMAAAAALAGLVAGWLWWPVATDTTEQVSVAYSTEPAVKAKPDLQTTQADDHFMTFVEQHCRQEVAACSRAGVKELKGRLDDLNERKVKIEEKLSVFGNDPALVEAQIKIENERAEVTKQLVRELRI